MANAAPSLEQFGYRQELKRSLGLGDLVVYGLIFMVPIAPFGIFGFVYNASHGMVPLAYAVGLVAMLFTALSYVTMSRAYPLAGSVYAYASRAIGASVGFIAGWTLNVSAQARTAGLVWLGLGLIVLAARTVRARIAARNSAVGTTGRT